MTRADRHRNPTAMITLLAAEGGLVSGVDFNTGDPFSYVAHGVSHTLYTAMMLGEPEQVIANTIKVIDKCGFQVGPGMPRWSYIDLPQEAWMFLTPELKKAVIGRMYSHEGGTALVEWFE